MELRKTALAVGLALSGAAAQAAMYQPAPAPAPACNPSNVTVPCERTAWDLGLEVILVEPTSGHNWIYAITERTDGASSNSYTYHDFDPGYGFGWRLEGSYHWGTGSDFTVNWTHLDDDSSATTEDPTPSGNNVESPYVNSDDTDLDATTIIGNVDNKVDHVNFEFGQRADFGQNYNVRLHYGFTWARVESNWDIVASDDNATDTFTYANNSKFDGLGVRGGVDTAYDFGNGFMVEGKLAAGLLVGDGKVNANLHNLPLSNEDNTFYTHNQRMIVPELDSTVDVRYTHGLANGDLSFYAGWRFVHYWNAVHSMNQTHNSTKQDSDSARIGNHDFGFHGPFLGIKWVGNA